MKLTNRIESPSGFSTNQTYIHVVDTNNPTQDPAGSSFKSTIDGAISGSPFVVIVSGTGVNSSIRRNVNNIASGNNSGALGGSNNQVIDNWSIITGGQDNLISGGTHSFIGGGRKNTISFCDSTIGGGYSNVISGYANVIGGGKGNYTYSYYSTIGGGSNNKSCDVSVVGGGFGNQSLGAASIIAGGANNINCGICSTIGGGQNNHISGVTFSTIGGGSGNTSSGQFSTIGGGGSNIASGCGSTIIGGFLASAPRWGQRSYASGVWSGTTTPGQIQQIDLIGRNTTSGSTPVDIFLDGSSQRISILDETAMFVTINIGGITSGGTSGAHYIRKVAIKNVGGTTSLIGTVSTIGTDVEDNVNYDVVITADDTNDSLNIEVTGDVGDTMRWMVHISGVEIKYSWT